MNWLQSIVFGFVYGLSEFLPISAPAHKELMKYLFGVSGKDPLLDLLCSLAALFALIVACRGLFDAIRRDQRMALKGSRTYHRVYRGSRDLRIVKNAAIPMLILLVVFTYIADNVYSLPLISVFLILNGILLYVPSRMIQGNKDSRSMSALDSLLFGVIGGLSAFPGLSRVGLHVSVGRMRGADSTHALNWALLLSIPALAVICVLSLFSLFAGLGTISFSCNFFTYLLAFIGTFAGGYAAIFFLKILAEKNSFTPFAYYSWGAALFLFIMYLI